MGKRKITCNNSSCKHHTNGGCDTCITLDGSGKCESFEKGFTEEYWNWVKENRGNEINHLMRDFLSEVKGYCLIHNPSGYTGYIVTNMKNLTKQQKEFLYGYFMDMGDRFKAEQFVDFD